MNKKLKDTTVK